ncbi:WD40-repeat-containing domain protein [Lipomyces oligophaga]|uniref:WD40-repeat-containing domain protein n=1 Tax=Lipomyces oligophaga TaxID=45792 RepID=UPI0034CE2438
MELRAEIEVKKAKLADLRRLREQQRLQHSLQRDNLASPGRSVSDRRSELDQLVAGLVGSPRTPGHSGSIATPRAGQTPDVPERIFDIPNIDQNLHLTTETFTVFDLPPTSKQSREETKITYSKEVQTDDSEFSVQESTAVGSDLELKFSEDELRMQIQAELESKMASQTQDKDNSIPERNMKVLSEKELDSVVKSKEFYSFLKNSTKVVERALDDDYDILVDYTKGISHSFSTENEWKIQQSGQFYSDKWSKGRSITSLDWSKIFPELILASYSKNVASSKEPLGVVQVWDTHLKSHPEFVFTADSDVTVAKWSPFHQNLIVGGCYNGQIQVWDTRAGMSAVHKSSMNGVGHMYPVYSLDFVGAKSANSIISCSTDGRICTWSVDMLAEPFEFTDLKLPPPSRTEELAPTALGVSSSDQSFILLGSEDGNVYSYNRTSRTNSRAGLSLATAVTGHFAPLTGMHCHPSNSPLDLTDLVLTSSLDWTVKLWKVQKPTSHVQVGNEAGLQSAFGPSSPGAERAIPNAGMQNKLGLEPLLEFIGEDSVYDVSWSPVRSGVFASTGSSGKVDIWDLTIDKEVPFVSQEPAPIQSGSTQRALNKIVWDKDGKYVATGGLSGVLTVFEVSKILSTAKAGEWTVMRKLASNKR